MSLLKYHRGPLLQRGHGIGSIFKSILRFIAPSLQSVKSVFAKGAQIGSKIAKNPAVKDVMNTVRDSAIDIGLSTAADTLEGLDLKQSLDKNLTTGKLKVAESLRRGVKNVNVNKQIGKKKKIKKRVIVRPPKVNIKKNKKTHSPVQNDLFDESNSD